MRFGCISTTRLMRDPTRVRMPSIRVGHVGAQSEPVPEWVEFVPTKAACSDLARWESVVSAPPVLSGLSGGRNGAWLIGAGHEPRTCVNLLRHALGAETATLPVAAVMILPGFWRCSGARSCPPPISSDAGLSWRGH